MRIDNQALAKATGEDRKKLERALNDGRWVFHACDAIGKHFDRVSAAPVTLSMLANPRWKEQLGIEYEQLDKAKALATKLLADFDPDTTVEIANDDVALIALVERVDDLLRVTASWRPAAPTKSSVPESRRARA